jgi:hypothetical protein
MYFSVAQLQVQSRYIYENETRSALHYEAEAEDVLTTSKYNVTDLYFLLVWGLTPQFPCIHLQATTPF